MPRCERCPMGDGPCAGETTPAACAVAANGSPAGLRWIAERSGEPAPTPAYPSLAAQARNLAGAAVQIAASGGATVDEAEYQRRRATCKACPTNRYVPADDACSACGCYLKYKPRFEAMSCPDGHW